MNQTNEKIWAQIITLTNKMCELAVPNQQLADLNTDEETARQPWQKIAKLDKQRLELLQQVFSEENVTVDDAEKLREYIEYIRQSDQKIHIIAMQLKKEIGQTFSDFGKAQHASSVYRQIKNHE